MHVEAKLTFLFTLLLGESYCVVIVFCSYSGFESASLNWNTVKSGTEEIHNRVLSVSK